LGQEKQEFIVWEKLSRLNASMGDFSAYLHCSIKFLKLLDKHVDESSSKTIEEYKMEVYENISSLLYKYTPNEVYNIAQLVLNNLENATDDKKLLNLYNKMLQGCFIGGNYSYALDLIHKILRKFSNASLNPQDVNFNVKYFLISLVKIEVLFSIGNLKDCVEAGEEILGVLTPSLIPQLKPENLSAKQFEEVIYDAMCFVALSKVLLLQGDLKDFSAKIQTNTGQLPKVFDMFSTLEKIVKGEQVLVPSGDALAEDKFSKVVFSIIKAFGDENVDYNRFADNIYQAKLSAKMNKLTQIELIGYSYFKLGQEDKASLIYYNVLESSTKNGLKMVTYLDWYLISMLKFEQQDLDVAFGIAHNAVIQLEKDRNSGDFIFYLFRIFLAKIYTAKGNHEAAESCLNDAGFIKEKYGLNL
jgi:tetratricopeptide (TPR) repeat protein